MGLVIGPDPGAALASHRRIGHKAQWGWRSQDGSTSYGAIAAMCLAMMRLCGTPAVFWAMPSASLSGTAAAAAFAFNSVSQIGGFVCPFYVGWIKDAIGSFQPALYLLVAWSLVSALAAAAASGRCIRARSPRPTPPCGVSALRAIRTR